MSEKTESYTRGVAVGVGTVVVETPVSAAGAGPNIGIEVHAVRLSAAKATREVAASAENLEVIRDLS